MRNFLALCCQCVKQAVCGSRKCNNDYFKMDCLDKHFKKTNIEENCELFRYFHHSRMLIETYPRDIQSYHSLLFDVLISMPLLRPSLSGDFFSPASSFQVFLIAVCCREGWKGEEPSSFSILVLELQ